MKLKDFEDNGLFTWWTLVDENGKLLGNMSSKCGDIYKKYKDYKILKIYDIDIDANWENNYVTVMLEASNNER